MTNDNYKKNKRKILFVDDEPDIIYSIKRLLEEKRSASDTSKNDSDNMNMEDLQKMTSDVATAKSSSNNDITTIGGGQMRKVPFRTLRA